MLVICDVGRFGAVVPTICCALAGSVDRFGTGAVVEIGSWYAVVVESTFSGIEVVAFLGGDRLRLRDDRVDRLPEGGRFQ